MGAKVKEFQEYISSGSKAIVRLEDYSKQPATAFLKHVVEAKDAATMCMRTFRPHGNKKYSQDAIDSMYIISAGLLAGIMGNFETYQKYLFANMFEFSIYLNKFTVNDFLRRLGNAASSGLNIDLQRLASYRDNHAAVGLIIADNLKNWQSPTIVNEYFKSFRLQDAHGRMLEFYTTEARENLSVLWQMRHSIVHTASTITIPDSQKIDKLNPFANQVIALEKNFILEVARKLHPIIKEATEHMRDVYLHNLKNDIPQPKLNAINDVFKVTSSCSAWLR